MSIGIEERLALLHEMTEISREVISEALRDNNQDIVVHNLNRIAKNYLMVGLIEWRNETDPTQSFQVVMGNVVRGVELSVALEQSADFDFFNIVYTAYLLGQSHPPVDLAVLEEQPKITGFFGNVLMGYADIADWPQYRDAVPKSKRYDLARRTNELYAGLLAGSVSAEEGVKLGEQLWAEREDDTFFDTGTGGFDDDNEMMVDYKLGAILKKIGSTVPTVHAWRW